MVKYCVIEWYQDYSGFSQYWLTIFGVRGWISVPIYSDAFVKLVTLYGPENSMPLGSSEDVVARFDL